MALFASEDDEVQVAQVLVAQAAQYPTYRYRRLTVTVSGEV
jgi:hypothetical protein